MATLEFVFGFIKVSAISTCSLEVAYFCKAALSNTSIESIISCVLVGSVLYITSALTRLPSKYYEISDVSNF